MPPQPAPACPKCGHPRPPAATECPACGVLYARYRAAPAPRPGPAPPADSPARPVYLAPRALEALLRALAGALEAGLTPAAFARSGGLAGLPQEAAARLRTDADAGAPPSRSLEALGVDPWALGLLRAKEAHGATPAGLRALADGLAQRRKARNRLLALLLYPFALTLAAAVIVPAPRLFTLGLGAYLARAGPAVLLVLGVPLFALLVLPRLDPGGKARRAAVRLAARLPLAAGAVRDGALASLAEVLGAAIDAGLPVRAALPLAAEAASAHPDFTGVGAAMVARLDAGASLAEALAAASRVPPGFLGQVRAGEASGTLPASLEALRKHHLDRARAAWLALAIGAGAAAFVLVSGALAWQIISGFGDALRTISEKVDGIAPPP